MSENDKELLLKDLCNRLPYGVIVRHADPLIDNDGNETGEFWYKRGYLCDITTLDDMTTTIIESEGSDKERYEHICFLERSLPYLRQISSMTEEEKEDLLITLLGKNDTKYFQVLPDGSIDNNDAAHQDLSNFNIHWINFDGVNTSTYIDWLNAHHFDVRHLIEKGLAIDCTNLNIY